LRVDSYLLDLNEGGPIMCQSTAYILKDGKEEEIMADIATIIPEGKKLRLITLFGEEKEVEASITEINLLLHKILLKPE
jgi:predicted RNA-binding protein